MKALIIGATGFVGGHLINELEKARWDVCGTKLPTEKADISILLYELDIQNAGEVLDVITQSKPDCVFHLAAQSSVAVSWNKPALTVDINVKGVINLLEAVRAQEKPPKVILVGSSEEYGEIKPDELPVSENTPLRPVNMYACTKATQGMIGKLYAKAYNLSIISVRAFNHIGPGQSDTFVIPNFCKQVAEIEATGKKGVIDVGNLNSKRDFTDVRDIVRAYRLLADYGKSGEVYNIGSGKAISIEECLRIILEQSKTEITTRQVKSRMRPSDTPTIEADISRLVECTGWKPEILLNETLADVLAEWRRKTGGG